MDKPVRELIDSQLDGVCGGSVLHFLVPTFVKMANDANAALKAAADHQRQLNDRMAQLRDAQAKFGNLQI